LKRSITIILIAAVVILLAVYGFIGMDYLKQHQEHQALSAQITTATRTLAQIPKPPQDLEQKLAAAEASLATAQTDLPKELNSTQIINAILKLASDCQVKAIPLSTKPWAKENTGEGYYVFRLNMVVSGGFSQLTNFVTRLEKEEFTSLVIEDLSVTRAVNPSEVSMTADLGLAIYAQFAPAE
jgi:Tfp pilus assembly protein PilO